MTFRIFVAGASAELERVRSVMRLVDTHPMLASAYDWTIPVECHGADPLPRTVTKELREDLYHLRESDGLLVVVPPPGVKTEGAWVELGVAMERGIPIVMLGACGPGYGWLHEGCSSAEEAVDTIAGMVKRRMPRTVSL